MPEVYTRKPNTICAICKKSIYRRPSQIKRNKKRVFCSLTCYGASCKKEKPCLVCGKLILASLNKKTCSRECSNKNRAGVKYKIGRPKDKVNTLRILKLRLIKKRGKNCERCPYDKHEILQIHHKNRNTKDNQMDNLEILCPNCHYEEHFLISSGFS